MYMDLLKRAVIYWFGIGSMVNQRLVEFRVNLTIAIDNSIFVGRIPARAPRRGERSKITGVNAPLHIFLNSNLYRP